MTLSLTKPGGWGINTKLRSSEATALDANTIKALDRTAAGDTLLGVVTLASGAGLVLDSGSGISLNISSSIVCHLGSFITMESGTAIGFDSGATLQIGGTDRIVLAARSRTTVPTDTGVSTSDTTSQLPHFGTKVYGWIQQGLESVTSAFLQWRLRAIPGMTSITATIGLVGTSHFSVPATKARLSIYRHTIGAIIESPTEVAGADDPASTTIAYAVPRQLTCSLSAVDTTQYYYSVRLRGEGGSGAIVNGILCDLVPIITASYSRIAEEF